MSYGVREEYQTIIESPRSLAKKIESCIVRVYANGNTKSHEEEEEKEDDEDDDDLPRNADLSSRISSSFPTHLSLSNDDLPP
uniref:Uncharacterized protein n=1 Tax=Vespula pensylvanica TaxID=30213 RepID=A0A834UA31_VESPE|nr:hypothetical protein H0235_007743 [Vespula pensylvanica]